MFLLRTKLKITKNLFINIQTIPGYGLYRRNKLSFILKQKSGIFKGSTKGLNLIFLKFLLGKIFYNFEFEKTIVYNCGQLKQNIMCYQGLGSYLNLPVHGQGTKTNASTQGLLVGGPRQGHFIQKGNRGKLSLNKEKKISEGEQ